MNEKNPQQEQDEHKLIAARREKLTKLREEGVAFPNDFRRNVMAGELQAEYEGKDNAYLEANPVRVALAGRMMLKRVMGKLSFAHVMDMSGQIQLWIERDALPEGMYQIFKTWDLGDIIGAEGTLIRTQKGELSLKVDSLRLLTKALRPLPDKFKGLSDTEQRYRQRYIDLIMNEPSRETFRMRTRIVRYIRNFLDARDFLEVETPMMQSIPGGATARPFTTHHNALDMQLFLRIAPELYLKRLVVGGFERVYEINRNYRNQGLSTRHNPEFTMLEFYEAYANYHDLMDLTEELLRGIAQDVLGKTVIEYQGETYDFGKPFRRMTVKESILHFNPELTGAQLDDLDAARAVARQLEIPLKDGWGLGKVQIEIFEKTVEHRLKDPTFITAYPTEVSPLARRSDEDPFVTDRFEFFVGGREIANGFSELNDYEDQAERFRKQVAEKDAGDEEAMLFTDSPSIRDVLLFPHMRPEAE